MPKGEDYDEEDDEMSAEEEGFLMGYKEARKKRDASSKVPELAESDEFEDERLADE